MGVVAEVWSEYVQSTTVTPQKPSGNPGGRGGAIVDASRATTKVQEFERMHTAARDVMDFLVKEKFICIDYASQDHVETGLRIVQRFLVSKGYQRGSRRHNFNYQLEPHIAAA